jgi:hypothetical protein
MDKIHSKQIEGVVDTTTQQIVAGEKTFNSPINFQPAISEIGVYAIRIEGGWIYWALDINNLMQDGNFRIGISRELVLVSQVNKNGNWEPYTF